MGAGRVSCKAVTKEEPRGFSTEAIAFALFRSGVVFSTPGTKTQYWHADGSHTRPPATFDTPEGGGAPPDAVCVFLPLIDLTAETGFTTFWPGTQHFPQEDLLAHSLPRPWGCVEGAVTAGSAILYDFRTVHRGEPNRTDSHRPICYFVYARPGFDEVSNFAQASLFDVVT